MQTSKSRTYSGRSQTSPERSRGSPGARASWLDLLRALLATEQGLEDFALLMRYIHRTADFPPAQLGPLVRHLGPKAAEVAMTGAERLRAEGKAEGEVAGQAELLLRQLSLRFGELSDEVRAQIAGAGRAQLALYAERVLTAASLDEVLR